MIEISKATADEDEILKKAIITYGEAAQQDMMIEEMSELTKAILKLRRSKSKGKYPVAEVTDVLEEMADVQIMLDQMYIIFGVPEKQRIYKINRLKERLGIEDTTQVVDERTDKGNMQNRQQVSL